MMAIPSQDELVALDELVSTMRALGVASFKLDSLEVTFFSPAFQPDTDAPEREHGNMDVNGPEDDEQRMRTAHTGIVIKQPEKR